MPIGRLENPVNAALQGQHHDHHSNDFILEPTWTNRKFSLESKPILLECLVCCPRFVFAHHGGKPSDTAFGHMVKPSNNSSRQDELPHLF